MLLFLMEEPNERRLTLIPNPQLPFFAKERLQPQKVKERRLLMLLFLMEEPRERRIALLLLFLMEDPKERRLAILPIPQSPFFMGDRLQSQKPKEKRLSMLLLTLKRQGRGWIM